MATLTDAERHLQEDRAEAFGLFWAMMLGIPAVLLISIFLVPVLIVVDVASRIRELLAGSASHL